MSDSVPSPLVQPGAGSTGGAPTRDELAKIVCKMSRHPSLEVADAILARWPAASRVPSESPPAQHDKNL